MYVPPVGMQTGYSGPSAPSSRIDSMINAFNGLFVIPEKLPADRKMQYMEGLFYMFRPLITEGINNAQLTSDFKAMMADKKLENLALNLKIITADLRSLTPPPPDEDIGSFIKRGLTNCFEHVQSSPSRTMGAMDAFQVLINSGPWKWPVGFSDKLAEFNKSYDSYRQEAIASGGKKPDQTKYIDPLLRDMKSLIDIFPAF